MKLTDVILVLERKLATSEIYAPFAIEMASKSWREVVY